MSIGARKLLETLRLAYGDQVTIHDEWPVGLGLFLDFYIPSLALGFEYHGRQHSEFVAHFHQDAAGYQSSRLRDTVKIDLCAEQGIALVVFWDGEEITVDEIYARSMEALGSALPAKEKKDPVGDRRREYAREQYQKFKNSRKK